MFGEGRRIGGAERKTPALRINWSVDASHRSHPAPTPTLPPPPAVYLPGTPGAPPPPGALLPAAVVLLCVNRAALASTLQPLAVTGAWAGRGGRATAPGV